MFPVDYISNEIEDCLIKNLNECFKNELFSQLNVSTIFRIIEKSDINQIKSDALFEFISKSIEERCCLLNFLDVKNLSDEKFEFLCKIYLQNKSLFIYLPNDVVYLKKMMDLNKKNENEIIQLKQNQQQIENQIKQANSRNDQLQNQIEKIKTENQQIVNQNNVLINENKSLKEKLNQIKEENKILCEKQNIIKNEYQNLQYQLNKEKENKNHFENLYNELLKESRQNLIIKEKVEEENKIMAIKNNEFVNQINEMKKEKLNDKKIIEDSKNFNTMIEKFVMDFNDFDETTKSKIFFLYL